MSLCDSARSRKWRIHQNRLTRAWEVYRPRYLVPIVTFPRWTTAWLWTEIDIAEEGER